MATLTFCCGAECGIVADDSTATPAPHWNIKTGGATVTTVTTVRAGGGGTRSYRFAAAGSASDLRRTISGGTVQVARAYIYFESLPNLTCNLFGWFTASSNFVGLRYNTTGTRIEGVCGTTASADAVLVTTGVWYRVDIRGTVSAALVLDTQIDGVALAQVSTGAASTITSFRVGVGVSGSPAVTGIMLADEIACSGTSGDYPLGAGTVAGLFMAADGAHNYEAVGDFTYNGTDSVPLAATDTHEFIDDLMVGSGTFLAATAADAGEYLEWTPEGMPEIPNVINGIEVVSAHHAESTPVNKQSLHFLDGQTEQSVFDDADFSATTLETSSRHFATAPSTAVAWTQAQVEALRFRWASTFGATEDIVPVPYLDGLCIEVDYTQGAPVTLTSQVALFCYTVDHLVTFSVGEPPIVGVEGAPGNAYVRRMEAGPRGEHVHRYMRGETEDR